MSNNNLPSTAHRTHATITTAVTPANDILDTCSSLTFEQALLHKLESMKQNLQLQVTDALRRLDRFAVHLQHHVHDAQHIPSFYQMEMLECDLEDLFVPLMFDHADQCELNEIWSIFKEIINRRRTEFAQHSHKSVLKKTAPSTTATNAARTIPIHHDAVFAHSILGISYCIDVRIAQFLPWHDVIQWRTLSKQAFKLMHGNLYWWPQLLVMNAAHQQDSTLPFPHLGHVIGVQNAETINAPWIRQAILYTMYHESTERHIAEQLSIHCMKHRIAMKKAQIIVAHESRMAHIAGADTTLLMKTCAMIPPCIVPTITVSFHGGRLKATYDQPFIAGFAHRVRTIYHRFHIDISRNENMANEWNAMTQCETCFIQWGTIVPPSTIEVHCLDVFQLPKTFSFYKNATMDECTTLQKQIVDSTAVLHHQYKKDKHDALNGAAIATSQAHIATTSPSMYNTVPRTYKKAYYYVYLCESATVEAFVMTFNQCAAQFLPLTHSAHVPDDPTDYFDKPRPRIEDMILLCGAMCHIIPRDRTYGVPLLCYAILSIRRFMMQGGQVHLRILRDSASSSGRAIPDVHHWPIQDMLYEGPLDPKTCALPHANGFTSS